ncbi:MAG TPA: arabinofuranosidase catalytic domain-containing protein, partial [Polyangiaceae bacterium]|nr:arabinofuranosidase catalytic domain-containing protein [Polyangiaceae bacterium]
MKPRTLFAFATVLGAGSAACGAHSGAPPGGGDNVTGGSAGAVGQALGGGGSGAGGSGGAGATVGEGGRVGGAGAGGAAVAGSNAVGGTSGTGGTSEAGGASGRGTTGGAGATSGGGVGGAEHAGMGGTGGRSSGGFAGGGASGGSSAGAPGAAGSAATEAPCDIYKTGGTPCVAAHSTVRALFAAYGGKLYQVKNSGGTTKDITAVANGGVADSASQDAFCSGTTCVVTIVYDQTGNGNDLSYQGSGSAAGGMDTPASATGESIKLGGSKVYSLYIKPGNSYWV